MAIKEKKEKVFNNNGYSISNGRILKKGLPIDGPEHGFFISPSLFNTTKKISDDNILILSYENNHIPKDISIKGILSFARSYAKLKEKSLIVTEDIANKCNVINFISGPAGGENENSPTYPMTVGELREMSRLLENKFVIRPSFSRFTFNNAYDNKFYHRTTLETFIIPEEVKILLSVDKMSENYINHIKINLKSISENDIYGNNYENLEIESTINKNADLSHIINISHIVNDPIISLPKISKTCGPNNIINFNINFFKFSPEILSHKEAFKNINDRVSPKIYIGGISFLSNFFSSLQKDNLEKKQQKIAITLNHLPVKQLNYLTELFENLKVIKELFSEKPELFYEGFSENNTGKSLLKEDIKIDFEKKLDYCISQDTPEIRGQFQEIYEKKKKLVDKLKERQNTISTTPNDMGIIK